MVFYQGGRDIIGDYLSHHGFDRGALLQVLLYARLHGLSFWLALWKAIKERASPTPWKLCEWNDKAAVILMPDTLFHSADLWTRSRYWAESLEYLPQAKARHIATMTLMNDMARPNARGRYLQVVQPLFSQPLVELAIQIPTYMFSWPGVDRGLARLAFADLLPNKILFRQSKGSPGSYFDQIFDKNFCKIKEILRNSPLLDNGMFDPEKFKECFENGKKQNSQLKGYVMETISCHYWLERWMRSH